MKTPETLPAPVPMPMQTPTGEDEALLRATEPLQRFRALVLTRLGLEFQDRQLPMLTELLERRVACHRLDANRYLHALESGLLIHEFEALAPELTTGETYFFRNIEQFNALQGRVLPSLIQARANTTRRLRILSAGCASGEELYTIAMLMHDLVPGPNWEVTLLGVDLNPEVLRKAREARYTSWSLRETPEPARLRWFKPEGSEFALHPMLRAAVRFEALNLNAEAPDFWRPGSFDLIFARNVLMYFNRHALHAAIARMTRSLSPDGYFFLGHSESLRDLTQSFELCHTHGTFYYQRKGSSNSSASAAEFEPDPFAAIGKASERVRDLTTRLAAGKPLGAAATMPASVDPVEEALNLFSQERFDAASALLDGMDAPSRRHADVMLLRAMLLVHEARFQEAEDLAHELLTHDVRSAAAHYVIALCRESTGDLAAARNRYEQASRLDSGFALPRLHLGRLARQRGDAKSHKHDLARALTLLEHESPQRLLMFGGGFDRIALQNMCRSELRATEGRKT